MAKKIKASVNTKFNGEVKLTIKHKTSNGYTLYKPKVEGGITWETERQGSPGKLTFKVLLESGLNIQEGDVVTLKYKRNDTNGWIALFKGRIFTKKRNKDKLLDITAYDQLRYFKNKATYAYVNKKASDVVKMVARDFNLTLGTIDSTNYVIGSRLEEDQSLFDIIQNALDLTFVSTGKKYVLYSDNDKLNLRNIGDLKTNIVINEQSAKDFDYSSSIDENTYTEIELYYDNDETNKREYYLQYSTSSMGKWGRLRYTENLNTNDQAKLRAEKMLELYNQKTRKLSVKEAFGDYRCRAGASVLVNLDVGDIEISNYMLIESAKHIFKNGIHLMDLTLDGFQNDNKNATSESKYFEVQMKPDEEKKDDKTNNNKDDDTKTTTTPKNPVLTINTKITGGELSNDDTPTIIIYYFDKNGIKKTWEIPASYGDLKGSFNLTIKYGTRVEIAFELTGKAAPTIHKCTGSLFPNTEKIYIDTYHTGFIKDSEVEMEWKKSK